MSGCKKNFCECKCDYCKHATVAVDHCAVHSKGCHLWCGI